ncbi:dual specificity protein phosphatase 18 [Electrophorus electricus]|uniref:dual specificity protein phosphatase 18 n=1 Tax=Electrophorus electricus TaxID=8005 RepID=UPI0015CF94E4|nr:dual specificity protein phosphatase 18 [Electrophorus electricus]
MSVPGTRLSGLGQITDYLYIGNSRTAKDSSVISHFKINCIINATEDVIKVCTPSVEYVRVPVTDSPETQLGEHFDTVADKIHKVRTECGCVLVHCKAGVSRSAALCLAYLMKYRSLSLVEAHRLLKARRPIIRPNSGFWQQLIEYELKIRGTTSVTMVTSPVGQIPDLYEHETKDLIPL